MQLKQQLRTKQQLSLSPQLKEAIRLMQLSAIELRAEIEILAESNPLLVLKSHAMSTPPDSYPRKMAHSSDEFSEDNESEAASEQSLQEILLSQLNQEPLSEKDEIIGLAIIDSINADGYLSLSCTEIASMLLDQGISANETTIKRILTLIQSFDPPGIGARSLAECLLLQLQRSSLQNKVVDDAKKILIQPLNLLLYKDKQKLIKQSGLNREEFNQGWQVIQSLNPRPGAHYVPVAQNYSAPDVIVRKVSGEWKIELNELTLPRVSINQNTLALLDRAKGDSHQEYRRQRLIEAKWLINSLENRQQTLSRVAQQIVDGQQAFLEHGPIAMRPMTLQAIALAVAKHESTVSRITTQKTILTPHGLFELKHFFSSHINTEDGCGVSSKAIQVLIQRLIAEEDSKRPYSDSALCQIMKKQGIKLARRTIAKYRGRLGLLSSGDRKDT